MKEYRAVFRGPGRVNVSHGLPRDSLQEALKDHPKRAEETLQSLVGVETREVTAWDVVPLNTILKESGAEAT